MKHLERDMRRLVEAEVDRQWLAFAARHPRLADAIDRTRLIEAVADRLRDDPAVNEVLAALRLDSSRLGRVTRVRRLVEAAVRSVLN